MTLSIMTLNITTLTITRHSASIRGLYVILSITMLCYYAECGILFTFMLNVVILSVVMLSVVMLIIVAPTEENLKVFQL